MGNEFNKTEADFAYERYTKMSGAVPEEGIPVTSKDLDRSPDESSDPTLTNDPILAADIGLNLPDAGLGPRRDRPLSAAATPGPERDELLESDAVYTAGAAGLTGGIIDYADDTDEAELTDDAGEEPALADVPDADELAPGSRVDPVSPDPDAMPGTDVLNGSSGDGE